MVSVKIAKNKKENPKPGHPIHTLISEHEIILSFLDKLERLNKEIQKNDSLDKESFKSLKNITHHLIEAEPHYQREEKVLFPELEKRGIFGPPEVMRGEHKKLREVKERMKKLAENFSKMKFDSFKKELKGACNFLLPTLRDHILKENNILYPMALEAIKEEEVWQKIKKDCDRIGYCCFTPRD